MAAMFLAMVWHARRRQEALRLAERAAEERAALLEQQDPFPRRRLARAAHAGDDRARAPRRAGGDRTLGRARDRRGDRRARRGSSAILERLLLLARAGEPSLLVDAHRSSVEPLPRGRVHALDGGRAARLEARGPRRRASCDADPDGAAHRGRRSAGERRQVHRGGRSHRAAHHGPGRPPDDRGRRSGCGVPPDALPRIFERFARADPARTRAGGGVGLGLAIADAVAKAHGGGCSVRSSGEGSVFGLRLPGFTAAPSAPAPPAIPPVLPARL